MKLFVCFMSAMILLSSCAMKTIPLKGTYPITPLIYGSTKSFDQIWDKLIDVFAQKGLAIKIIDRTSGLIVSDSYSLNATVENKNGIVYDKNAFVAIGKFYYNGRYIPMSGSRDGVYSIKKVPEPMPVYGEWNVRIKPTATGGTSINININNLNYQDMKTKLVKKIESTDYKTTGVFEKQLFDLINN